MAQQTAVKWLIEQLVAKQNGNGDSRSVDEIFEQANEMEKQQLEKLALEYFKAGQDSMEEGGKSFDQYYTYYL